MTTINFDLSAGRDAIDLRWDPNYDTSRFHVKLHPSGTRSESNPCLVYVHGGGAAQNDGRLPFIANSNGNAVFAHLQARTDMKTVLVGFTGQQHIQPLNDTDYATGGIVQTDALGNAHRTASGQDLLWNSPQGNEPIAGEALFTQLKLFVMVLKSRAAEFGIDPDKIFLMGSSFGGVRSILSQLTGPLSSDDFTDTMRSYYGIRPGVTSRVAGVINHYGCPDFRLNTAIMKEFAGGLGYSGGGDWAGRSINDPIFTERYTGVFTRAQLAALPAWHTEQLSLLWYMEQQHANLQYLPPVYHLYEFIGQQYPRRFKTATEKPVNVTIVNGGTGFLTAGRTISVDGGDCVGKKVKLRIKTVGAGAVLTADIAPAFTDASYRFLPGQQAGSGVDGNFTTTLSNVTCTIDAGAGDTETAGTGLIVNLSPLDTVEVTTPLSTTYHGGLMWWAFDPHDDVLGRMIQRTQARYRSPVKFRYACPTEAQMLDASTAAQPKWTSDIGNWMQSVMAGNPLVGRAPVYYGEFISSDSSVYRELPPNWIITQ